jgi:hypothetical protein
MDKKYKQFQANRNILLSLEPFVLILFDCVPKGLSILLNTCNKETCRDILEFNDFLNLEIEKLGVELKYVKASNMHDDQNNSKNRTSPCSTLSDEQESLEIKTFTERRLISIPN